MARDYAKDIAVTVKGLGIIAQFARANSDSEYTYDSVGRTGNWKLSNRGITAKSPEIQYLIDSWSNYMSDISLGEYGTQVRNLTGKTT